MQLIITQYNIAVLLHLSMQPLKLQKQLRAISNVRVASTGGSAAGNTTVVVIIEEPLPLISILGEMPQVEAAVSKGSSIQVMLEPTHPAV